MSQKYLHPTAYLIACFLLMFVTLTACEQQLPQEVASELETEILSNNPGVDNFEVSTVRYAASKKLPPSVDSRWCAEVILDSDGQSSVEYYMIDQTGESFECKEVTEDQLSFEETGCYW